MSIVLIWTILFINLKKKHSGNKLDSAYFMIILGQIFHLRCIPNQIHIYPWLQNITKIAKSADFKKTGTPSYPLRLLAPLAPLGV